VILVVAVLLLNRPRLMTIDGAVPERFPPGGFSHQTFENLLHRYVDELGNVDYGRWQENQSDLQGLNSYLAAVSRFSPESTPERFASRQDELAYWLYAYNAYVIWSVLDNWPLKSVTDVKAPIEVVKGFGFFYHQRYLFGSKPYSLLTVENQKIRATYKDARIHFVLNCASESCPVLRPELPSGNDLEPFLVQATFEFINDPKNVAIDHKNERIILSDIFKWYEKDFVNDLRRQGLPSEGGLVEYLISVAPDAMTGDITAARDYSIEFSDYDWSLNNSTAN